MALIIEDGTAKSDSVSYVTEDELFSYASARGRIIAGTKSELLMKAMDYIEAVEFSGDKLTSAQALQYPRYGVEIDGYSVDSDSIPQLLKDAQCEVALSYDAGTDALADVEKETVSETVGEISVTYSSNASSNTYLKKAETKLRKLRKHGGHMTVDRS